MNKNTLYILAAALLLLPGCNKALDPVDGGAITVHAGIGAMTKVTTDGVESSFVEGDQIAVYAWTGSAAAVPAERVVDGVVNTLGSDGKWSPASQMLWKAGSDAHYFLGVSPVRAVSDFTADAVTLSGDYAKDDLLFSKRLEGLSPGTTPVALSFSHAMAKLTVNVKVRNEFCASPTVSVSVTAKSGATVNYLTQTVTATGDASARSLTAAANAPTGYTNSFGGIQVPQEGVRTITITVAGQDFVYEAGEDIPLKSGHNTTLGLIVGKDNLELSGVSVSDWTAGSAIAGGEAKRDFSRMPLTFEAQTAGAQVSFTLASTVSGVQYSTDGSTWTDYVSGTPITLANVGDMVMFRGDNAGYYASFSDYSRFSCSAACSVFGNIMSLVRSTDFATATTLTEDHAFEYLFKDNSNLRSDASKELVLPATTLSAYCYLSMFFGCSGLSSAPALPATTLTESCYEHMFQGCSNLTTAPALPATILAGHCYRSMFYNCSGLTTAPALPATTLANGCYNSMFYGCSGLATAPALPATTLAAECYRAMFRNCSGLTTAPALPATTLANNCYIFMFSVCTSLTTAPALPATTLATGCYDCMFEGCSNLASITCAATDISAHLCTSQWLDGVAASGTFTTPSSTAWSSGKDGIPLGWTRVDLP